MKYIKTYEIYDEIKSKTLLSEYSGLVCLSIPSQNYFRSDIKFTLIFVGKVYKIIYKDENYLHHERIRYLIDGDQAFQRSENRHGNDYYTIINWNQEYGEYEFDKLNFMTIDDFYERYTESFIQILEIVFDKLENTNLKDLSREIYNNIIDKLTIPETEHIINAKKYNL